MPESSLLLAQALDRIDAHEPTGEVLTDSTNEVRVLVELAVAIRSLPAPAPSAELRRRLDARWAHASPNGAYYGHANGHHKRRIEETGGRPMVGVGAREVPLPSVTQRHFPWRDAALRLVAASVACALIATGTVAVSANSLPGDALYPAKLVAEKAQMAVTLDVNDRARLQVAIAERRVIELETVVATAAPSVVASAVERASVELTQATVVLSRVNRDTVASDALAPSLSRETAIVGQKLERISASEPVANAGIKPAMIELERAAAAMSTAAREGSRAAQPPSAATKPPVAEAAPPTQVIEAPTATVINNDTTVRAPNPTSTPVVIAAVPVAPTATEVRPSATAAVTPTTAPATVTSAPRTRLDLALSDLDARIPAFTAAILSGQRESIEPQVALYYREMDALMAAIGDVAANDRDRTLAALSGRLSLQLQAITTAVDAAPPSARPALRLALIEISRRHRLVSSTSANTPIASPTSVPSPTIALIARATSTVGTTLTPAPTQSPAAATTVPNAGVPGGFSPTPPGPTVTAIATPAAMSPTVQPPAATSTPRVPPTLAPTQVVTPLAVSTPLPVATPVPTAGATAVPTSAPAAVTPLSLPTPIEPAATAVPTLAPPAAPSATPAK